MTKAKNLSITASNTGKLFIASTIVHTSIKYAAANMRDPTKSIKVANLFLYCVYLINITYPPKTF